MKVFVAGATGALGKQLVPQLVAAGHDVVGMTRSPAKADQVRALGARPAIADALDPDAVAAAVAEAEPEVIVHQLTALGDGTFDLRHIDRYFAVTNRLRTEGTDHLLAAGRAVGAKRFVAQSYAGWPATRTGGPVKDEDDPLDPDPPERLRAMLDAIRYLEQTVTTIDWGVGIVLRYGGFYGPGTYVSVDPEGEMVTPVRKRQFPVVGDGGGVWSFIHIADAAAATVAAIDHGAPGLYNVVDDEPARVRDWLPGLAQAVQAKPPWHLPRWLGRLMVGQAGTVMMTEVRGASNAKAKRELRWQPHYPNWHVGFAEGLR
jgi:nucleoside-diphosphate-sugar epimerase